jgi:RecA-family ATPase
MLTGSMKTNKSWTLLELAVAFAKELKWFGRECKEATVLYFDAEINQEFWQKRFRIICEQHELDPGRIAKLGRIKPVFIAGKDVTIKSLHAELIKWHAKGWLDGVDVIIIDPIYQLYEPEWKENGNEDMAKLGRFLRSLATATEIGTIFAHHHTKGSQEGKRDIEKSVGKERSDASSPFVPFLPGGHVHNRVLSQKRG